MTINAGHHNLHWIARDAKILHENNENSNQSAWMHISECALSHFATYLIIMKTRLRVFKYIENFTTKKSESFQINILTFFYTSARNIDCGYSLEHLQSTFFEQK